MIIELNIEVEEFLRIRAPFWNEFDVLNEVPLANGPTTVTLENDTDIKTVNYVELIPLMIGQITFLKDEVYKLKEEVVNLKTQINKEP
jgi:hypothetical protein